MIRRSLLFPLVFALLAAGTFAQLTVTDPNYSVQLVADDILASGERMAADRFANVFVSNQPAAGNGSVTRVFANGLQDPAFLTGIGRVGQIATNPLDGRCYVVERSPTLTVLLSRVWRLDPQTGATLLFQVDVAAEGMTIDNAGQFFFGGAGLQGPGIYRAGPPFSATTVAATFVNPGFGANAILQSLVNGDILIAEGAEVRRLTPTSVLPVPYANYQNQPNSFADVRALSRMSFNQFGAGAMIGVDRFSTFTGGHDGEGYPGDLASGSNAALVLENIPFNAGEFRSLAFGYRQSLYWMADFISPSGPVSQITRRLHRIRQIPAPGSAGSLIISQSPGIATFDLYGRPGSNAPFLMTATTGAIAPGGIFLPAVGFIDVNPLAPGAFTVLDGAGVFGPPNPLAVIPPSGHFFFSVSLPLVGPVSLLVRVQTFIVDALSPNGFFFITNVDDLVL